MTTWIISVVGLGLVCAIVGIVSNGMRLQRTIKTACTYIFILAFVLPFPSILSSYNLSLDCDGAIKTNYEQSVINVTNDAYFTTVAKAFDEYLSSHGYNAKSEIFGNVIDKIIIDNITVTLLGNYVDASNAKLNVRDLAIDYFEVSGEKVQVKFG